MFKVIVNEASDVNVIGSTTRWQRFRARLQSWWVINVSRRLPRLVWVGDELDVCVTFKKHGLGTWAGDLHKVEDALHRMGIGFDTGSGREGRDWEWDWSLSGPVSVTFRARASKPERRVTPPQPTLAFTNPERDAS